MLAFPKVGEFRIPGIRAKAMFDIGPGPSMTQQELPPESSISPDRIVDLTVKMDPAGRLTWEVPDGHWTILRLGHTSTGVENAPAPASGRGLECDKLSKEGIEANFAGMMAKLALDNQLQPETRPASHENPAGT
ncbi:MAG: glycosyl hydrolase, partial [Verrucomicrobiota bacterium]|nr:glycosyl hydrolase [Verrucomicrobiota bacterium]